LLKPIKVSKGDYIFMEGDPADEMFFLKEGKVAAILP
jgi:CRP-like cAMP-binding protein